MVQIVFVGELATVGLEVVLEADSQICHSFVTYALDLELPCRGELVLGCQFFVYQDSDWFFTFVFLTKNVFVK